MGRLTVSAFSFPQLTQIDSKIFFTLTKKPVSCDERAPRDHKISHTDVKDRTCKFDMAKMARALRHPLATSSTLEVAIYGAHSRIS
jgi:hypothetical protein